MLDRNKIGELVQKASKGDKNAFCELIDSYRQYMYAASMTVTRSEDDAMDAVQDTLLTIWQKLSTLRDPCSFTTWMTRILINNCYAVVKQRNRNMFLEDLEGENPDETVSLARDDVLDVRAAISRLPDEDKLLLQLFYFEDLPVKEIAEILSLSQEAVRMRLSRCRQKFKKNYDMKGGAV